MTKDRMVQRTKDRVGSEEKDRMVQRTKDGWFRGQRGFEGQRTGWFKGQRTGFKGQRTGRLKGQSTGRVQRTKDREGSEDKGQGGFQGQESSKPFMFDGPVSCDCGTVTTDWYSVTSCLLQGGFKAFSVRWSSFF